METPVDLREEMEIPLYNEEPFPDCVVDSAGWTFATGAIGGSAFHFFKGVRNSPKGSRLAGAAQAIRTNAPRIGGRFAAWGVLSCALNCSIDDLRQNRDPWNAIVSSAAASGLLSMRRGMRAASRSAVAGGGFFLLLVGADVTINQFGFPKEAPPQKTKIVGGAKWEALEGLDSPVPQCSER